MGSRRGFIFAFVESLLIFRTIDGACRVDREIALSGTGVTEISSTNHPDAYDNYEFCRYIITAPIGHRIKLEFVGDFQLEPMVFSECSQDSVQIIDTKRPGSHEHVLKGAACTALSPSLVTVGPFCGDKRPVPYITDSNTAIVQFCSDYELTLKGWKIELSSSPTAAAPEWVEKTIQLTDLTAPEQVIESPADAENYGKYYNGYTATYVITNDKPEYPVYLRKEFVYLGPNHPEGKCTDKLTIRDVTNDLTYVVCGSTISGPKNFVEHIEGVEGLEFLNSGRIEVTFESDVADAYRGFKFHVGLTQCSRSQFACDTQGGCYSPSQSCDGKNDCADRSDEHRRYCAPVCGKTHFPLKTSNKNNRIVGGTYANRHSLPWQVAFSGCGGTIISDRWILSAAHCFDSEEAPPGGSITTARIGIHDKTLTDEENGGQTVNIIKVVCNPAYDNPSKKNDQCLLKTRQTIKFRKNIVPACLPRQGEDAKTDSNFECMTSGWGNVQPRSRSEFDLVNTGLLKQVFVPVLSRDQCQAMYLGEYEIDKSMICAGNVDGGGIDSCQGDSGGPFICRKRLTDQWTVNGIVSYGIGCARAEKPGVYANAGDASNWIANTMARN